MSVTIFKERPAITCGILASLLYVAGDILGALWWEGYSYTSQTISELGAIGAPSRPLGIPISILHNALLIAFAIGVRRSATAKRGLRVTAGLLIGVAIIGEVTALFFPMHLRGAEQTLTDTMHIIFTGVNVFLIVLAMGFAATALGKRFRLYSIASILMLLFFGALAGMDGPTLRQTCPRRGWASPNAFRSAPMFFG